MPVRERIMNVLDPDSPFLEIQPLCWPMEQIIITLEEDVFQE